MASHQVEFFGRIIYGAELTYEDLLAREEDLKNVLREIMLDFQAIAVNFEALGDSLRVQCMFAELDEGLFRRFAGRLAPSIRRGLLGKLLFVDRDLEILYFFTLNDGQWAETILPLHDKETV